MITKKEAGLQRDKSKSSYYRTYEDSPNFYKNLGAFLVSETKLTDLETEFPESKKFFPITNIQIINDATIDIIFYPNQRSAGFLIPNGTSTIFDKKSLGGGLRSFKITNTSGSVAITSGEVEVNFWREGIVFEDAFRQLHKSLWQILGHK